MAKQIECSFCGSIFHYQTFCTRKPKKAIISKKPIELRRTPIKVKPRIYTIKPQKPLKRAYIKPKSTTSPRKVLIYELDKIFSIYIRRKDTILNIATCVTCGAKAPWEQMQNGHYIPRGRFLTRWEETNCHVQCGHCNETLSGNLEVYKLFMVSRYGAEYVEDIERRASLSNKILTHEIKEMIAVYNSKVSAL